MGYRLLVPAALEIQEFDGTSWVGLVPFRMVGVGPRLAPRWLSLPAFPEVNLRLYVEADGKPGVWFLSLDATSSLMVWIARRLLHLPYFKAEISLTATAGGFTCHSTRRAPETPARLAVDYAPTGDVYRAAAGSLEHWLTERYCLYAQSPSGRILRTEVDHPPWSLQPARATFRHNHLADEHGFQLPGEPALLHFSRRIDVVAWTPRVVLPPSAQAMEAPPGG